MAARSVLTIPNITAAVIGPTRERLGTLVDTQLRVEVLSGEGAATVILDGVRSGAWRILVGDDAKRLDAAVRADPERAYGPDGIRIESFVQT